MAYIYSVLHLILIYPHRLLILRSPPACMHDQRETCLGSWNQLSHITSNHIISYTANHTQSIIYSQLYTVNHIQLITFNQSHPPNHIEPTNHIHGLHHNQSHQTNHLISSHPVLSYPMIPTPSHPIPSSANPNDHPLSLIQNSKTSHQQGSQPGTFFPNSQRYSTLLHSAPGLNPDTTTRHEMTGKDQKN